MKKRIISVVMAIAICLSFAIIPAGAANASSGRTVVFQEGNDTAWINGSEVSLAEAPRVIDGRTMVPFRTLSEALDCSVEWVPGAEQIIITKNDDPGFKLMYQIGNTAVYKILDYGDEMVYRMDTAPVLSEYGNTLLPARYVAELLGYTANWADTYSAAVIYKSDRLLTLPEVKETMAVLLKVIDSSVTEESFTTDEERFAKSVYAYLNEYLVKKGERSLAWNDDLSKVCDYRAYERQIMGRWTTKDDLSYAYADNRQKLYEKTCGVYYIPETEVCLNKGTNALWLIQQVRYDEETWNVLKDADYTQVAVSAIKDGDGYRTLVIISGTGVMK